jgi:hypothetical protein
MADSFGTVGFTILQEGMGRSQSASITVQHVPGGNVNYVDYGGQLPLSLSYNVMLSEADYHVLEGTVGGTATLTTTVDGTITCAALVSLARNQRIPASGTTFAAAVFSVITP